MAALDYSLVHRVIDGTGRILDTTMNNPNTGSYITEAQLRDWIKGQTVQEGYYYNGNFYSNSGHTSMMAKVNGSLYVDKGSNALYYCLSSAYVALTEEAAVQAIRTELLNGTLEPLVSTKAKQDQNGNVIDTTYATKAELATEQNARESADSDLQSQIINTKAEVDNIEALIGDEAQVENVDPSTGSLLAQSRLIHHLNMLPNGEFGRVGARSVAWNQLLNKNNFPASTTYNNGNLVYTNNGDGSITLRTTATTTADVTIALESVTSAKGAVSGHTYVFKGGASGVKFGTGNGAGINEEGTGRVAVVTFSSSISMGYLIPSGTTIATAVTLYPLLCDLTTMNMASITADQFRALFPASYYPYDTGHIYDLNPTGFRIRGINLWDEETESGYIGSTGTMVSDANSLRSKNFCNCKPNTGYYFLKPSSYSQTPNICWYDSDKIFIERSTTTGFPVLTSPNNACYFKLSMYAYGSTYQNNVQIADNSLPDSIKTVYHPFSGQTVPVSISGHYVNENVYDYVTNKVVDGVLRGEVHTKVATYTIPDDVSVVNYQYTTYRITLTGKEAGKYNLQASFGELYSGASYNDPAFYNSTSVLFAGIDIESFKRNVYINIPSATTTQQAQDFLKGEVFYYEKEDVVTYGEPLRSFSLTDYCTIEPITPQDELVNRIDVPFSVKSVSANTLIEQITQNTADIAEEKATRASQVSALNKRVTNLELKTGDQFDVDYPSDTYGMDGVPANVEPYAKVKVLKGVGRIANNLVNPADSSTSTVNGITFTNNRDGSWTISGATGGSPAQKQIVPYIMKANHSYLLTGARNNVLLAYIGQSNDRIDEGSGIVATITTDTYKALFIYVRANVTLSSPVTIRPISTDLNIYFGTSDLSFLGATDSAKLATIQQKYPELLIPSDYGTSVVFPIYSAVKGVGVNLWDEEWVVGGIGSDGTDVETNTIRSKNLIRVNPSTTYYKKTEYNIAADGLRVAGYDIEGNLIGLISGTYENTFETPSNCFYVKIATVALSYGTAYKHDLQICLNSLPDAVKTTYHPYMTDTLSLPQSVTLRSAGSVAEEYYPETGRVTHPIGQVDLGTLTWAKLSQTFFYTQVTTKKIGSPVVCDRYAYGGVKGDSEMASAATGIYVGYTTQEIKIKDDSLIGMTTSEFRAAMSGVMLYYELATPDPDTYVDPILDPLVKVEPNGTVKPIQSQSPKVDSAMTVEYMAS